MTPEPKYAKVAARIRAQIAGGVLVPGESVPSGAALARTTGYSVVTCRQALRILLRDGVLVPGATPGARLRVPGCGEEDRDGAARALSASLATRRRAAGLTQPRFADLIDMSVTSVGHAETGRVWQSRAFWERADKVLDADGELLALHDTYRAAEIPPTAAAAAPDARPGRRETTGSTSDAHAVLSRGAGDRRELAGLLTADEREAVRQAGLLYTFIAEHVVADGPTRNDDLAELRAAVHVIQRAVLAQAAARAYLGEFRLLGGVATARRRKATGLR